MQQNDKRTTLVFASNIQSYVAAIHILYRGAYNRTNKIQRGPTMKIIFFYLLSVLAGIFIGLHAADTIKNKVIAWIIAAVLTILAFYIIIQ